MIIRAAQQSDLEEIRLIYNHAIHHTTAVYEYEPFSEEYIIGWFNSKSAQGFPVIVAIEDDRLVAFASYGAFRMRAAYQHTMEHSVYVHHEFRGKGIGKIMLSAIIESAKKNNIHALIGGIDSTNELSILMHKKMGFQQVGYLPEVAFKFGRWLDLVFVQKILSTDSKSESN